MPDFIFESKVYYNPVELVMRFIGGTWKMPILYRLRDKTLRYSEIKRELPKVTHKMLTQSLRELENDGFIDRKVYPVVPPKVEYSLTDRGRDSIKVIDVIREYGYKLIEELNIQYGDKV